jgi:hypothetical protein
MEERAIP